MIDQLIRTLKGVLPESTWDFIFDQFEMKKVRFTEPVYEAVMLNRRYMLVRVTQKEKEEKP